MEIRIEFLAILISLYKTQWILKILFDSDKLSFVLRKGRSRKQALFLFYPVVFSNAGTPFFMIYL